MKLSETPISGLMIAKTDVFSDHRGAFARLFCAQDLNEVIGDRHIVQANHSRTSTVGAVRGLHYQKSPHAEMKLVRCLRGRVWDVALDLRQGSSTFLHWHAEELSANTMQMLVIPEGFAHGFQVLEPDSELLYMHTEFYTPAVEGGVRHDDPRLAIDWPLAVTALSERDRNHASLTDAFTGIDS